MTKTLLNIVLFQLGWFVCIWGNNLLAIIYTGAALLIHHFFVARRRQEWLYIGLVTLMGVFWDAFVVYGGWITYSAPDILGLPIWLICLWLLFATTLQHSLVWLQRNIMIAAFMGSIFGPLSYWAGTNWGGATINEPLTTSLIVIGLGWFVLLPSFSKIARRLSA